MPYYLIYLTGFKYASDIKYARVLNMLQYSYNNIIIIVTNVIILEFLSARFVHITPNRILKELCKPC